jgi:hypothetical protein
MRPNLNVRKSRPVHATVGALMLAIPTSAVALSAGAADAQSALQVTLDHQNINYGQSLTATGVAPRSDAGKKLLLELEPNGGSWGVVGSAIVHSDGKFRIVGSPKQSGAVRAVPASDASTARDGTLSGAGGSAVSASPARQVRVSAALRASVASIGALSGQPVVVSGTLLPREAGRLVRLEGRSGRAWRALGQARTRPNGHFSLSYTPNGTGQQPVRLRFAGDRLNSGASTRTGQLTVYRQSLASWYDDGGSTACGFHANYGVANKDLPCGTNVTFRYGGRTVNAVVDDRGPYVGGREWDLNQNTAGALGFNGVDTVWSSR